MSGETDELETPAGEQPEGQQPSSEEQSDTRSDDEKAIAAFDEGLKTHGLAPDNQEGQDGGKPKDEGAAVGAEGGEAGDSGKAASEGGEGESQSEEAAAIEAEIKALGIQNEKTAERFRELSSRPKPEDVEPLRQRAERADQWDQTVAATGASPEQFGASLRGLADGVSDDPAKLKRAWDYHQAESARLAKLIGKETHGYDPLDEHPDLKKAVEDEDMDRKYALELAERRAAERRGAEHNARSGEEEQLRRAYQQGAADVTALNAELSAADPQFKAKLNILAPSLQVLRETVHPSQWAPTIRRLFAETVVPSAPESRKPAPGHVPIRPGGAVGSVTKQPKSELDAFNQGLEEFDRRRA